jgi:uncharacterized protein
MHEATNASPGGAPTASTANGTSTEGPAPHAAPVTLKERIAALDVIRGVALFGILVVNMGFYGGPLAFAVNDPNVGSQPFLERAVWWIEHAFFQGKFISVFSFLFGVGLALQLARLDRVRADALAAGVRSPIPGLLIARRLFLLGLFGLAHGLGLWYGDILFFYAWFGLVLIPLRYLSARECLVIALVLAGLSLTCMSGMTAMQSMQPPGELESLAALPDGPVSLEAFLEQLGAVTYNVVDPRFVPVEAAVYARGTWSAALVLRLAQWARMVPIVFVLYAAHILALFVLGMAAAKSRFFAKERVAWHRYAAVLGLAVGSVASASATTLLVAFDWQLTPPAGFAIGALQEIGTFALAIGYVGLLTCVVHGGVLGPLLRVVASAGRMALTVYISETVVITGLMYWWGFGYFDAFSRAERFGIAIVTWMALVVLANVWLSVFRMGPLEWLWRAGTYLEWPKGKDEG